MKRVLLILAVALTFAWTAMAQDQAATGSSQTTTTTTTKKSHKKAASSDASASDSASAESSKKSSTVTGCVSKEKNPNGNYTLTNGRYKNGVDITGSDDLSAHAGHKVQLTGSWTTAGKTFQESKIKHIADTCTAAGSKSASADTTTTTNTTKKSKKSSADASAPPKG